MQKPLAKPNCANFSSGPCAKRPNWAIENLDLNCLGRSHRSALGKERLKLCLDLMREVLELPADYRIGIMPASDTGAVEAALWSLLGAKGIDMLSWEAFGKGWVADVLKQLKLSDVRVFDATYGELPDMTQTDKDRDIVFTYNGTTSGVCLPNTDWIAKDRTGITICDATSAAFAFDLDWSKLDVTTFSWQKALGGEGGHGVIILSPKAVERLENYTPAWPMPKIFRMTANGKINEGIFVGDTINTPSMLCVEDAIDSLIWAKNIGGLKAMIQRSKSNFDVLKEFVSTSKYFGFLAKSIEYTSNTSVCLEIKDAWFIEQSDETQKSIIKKIVKLLADEQVALDCGAYKDAPNGLRFWCGATVETDDVKKLCAWLDWAYVSVK